MKLRATLLALGLLPWLTAGCLGNDAGPAVRPDEAQGLGSSSESMTVSIPLPPILNGTEETPSYINLDQCTSWTQFTLILPRDMNPGHAPSGWEQSDDPTLALAGGVGVVAYNCQKVGVGPYERGPVRILLDFHWNVNVPEDCKDGQATDHLIVARALISDAELAVFLNKTLSMPTEHAEFSESVTGAGDIQVHEWTWRVMGGDDSKVTIIEDGTHFEQTASHRYYWPWGSKLVRMKADVVEDGPLFGSRLGHGKYAAPMLMSQVAGGEFVDHTPWFASVNGTTTFQVFNDHFCLEPVG